MNITQIIEMYSETLKDGGCVWLRDEENHKSFLFQGREKGQEHKVAIQHEEGIIPYVYPTQSYTIVSTSTSIYTSLTWLKVKEGETE